MKETGLKKNTLIKFIKEQQKEELQIFIKYIDIRLMDKWTDGHFDTRLMDIL